MLRGWYVVSVLRGRVIEGPFQTRDDAIQRCIVRSSEDTIVKAISNETVTLHYYARFERGDVNKERWR